MRLDRQIKKDVLKFATNQSPCSKPELYSLKLLPSALPWKFSLPGLLLLLGVKPADGWQSSEKQLWVLVPEQALNSKALAISATLIWVEIIFGFLWGGAVI
ncbi:hypothetical protein DKB71_24145 [Pseudomonas sp. PLMAX]